MGKLLLMQAAHIRLELLQAAVAFTDGVIHTSHLKHILRPVGGHRELLSVHPESGVGVRAVSQPARRQIHEQGSLHSTPEHCLVNAGLQEP